MNIELRRYRPVAYNRLADLQGLGSDGIAEATATPAQIIRSMLVAFGLVTFPIRTPTIWPCYVGSVPDASDLTVCVDDTVGMVFGRGARTGKNCVHPGIAIRVRGTDHVRGFLQANKIAVALDTRTFPVQVQLVEDGSLHIIANVYRTSPVIALGEEVGKKRNLWTLNARVSFDYDEPSLG